MSLPYSYTKTVDYEVNLNLQKQVLLDLLSQSLQHEDEISDIKIEKESLSFKSKKSLLNFRFLVKSDIAISDKLRIRFNVNLIDLIKISVALIVVIPFLSQFNINTFFIFASIFILIFYFANLVFILASTKQTFEKALIRLNILKAEDMSFEQQNWQNDPSKCSACGYNINEFDLNCPDCGIMLKQNKFTKPLDLSKKSQVSNQNVKYHYKKKA